MHWPKTKQIAILDDRSIGDFQVKARDFVKQVTINANYANYVNLCLPALLGPDNPHAPHSAISSESKNVLQSELGHKLRDKFTHDDSVEQNIIQENVIHFPEMPSSPFMSDKCNSQQVPTSSETFHGKCTAVSGEPLTINLHPVEPQKNAIYCLHTDPLVSAVNDIHPSLPINLHQRDNTVIENDQMANTMLLSSGTGSSEGNVTLNSNDKPSHVTQKPPIKDPYPWLEPDDRRRHMTVNEILIESIPLKDSLLPEGLTPTKFISILERYREAFSVYDEVGCCKTGLKISLELTDEAPFRARPYKKSEQEKQYIQAHIDRMVACGVLVKRMSNYGSPVLTIPRKKLDHSPNSPHAHPA